MCTAIWKKIEISSKPSKLYVKVENEMISPEGYYGLNLY